MSEHFYSSPEEAPVDLQVKAVDKAIECLQEARSTLLAGQQLNMVLFCATNADGEEAVHNNVAMVGCMEFIGATVYQYLMNLPKPVMAATMAYGAEKDPVKEQTHETTSDAIN